MKLFHRHKFDPDKWVLVANTPVATQAFSFGVALGGPKPVGNQLVYSNTCTTCGNLVFRRVQEIE